MQIRRYVGHRHLARRNELHVSCKADEEWNLRIVTDTLLSSPKGANRSKTGCDSPPLGTLSPYYWLSAGSMTFGHSTSGY